MKKYTVIKISDTQGDGYSYQIHRGIDSKRTIATSLENLLYDIKYNTIYFRNSGSLIIRLEKLARGGIYFRLYEIDDLDEIEELFIEELI